jgi:hypothetical protein
MSHRLDHWRFAVAMIRKHVEPTCAHCGKPATCFGAYEGEDPPSFACDECCGHGCEDGVCIDIGEGDEPAPKLCLRCADDGNDVPATDGEYCAACHDTLGELQDEEKAR